MSKITYTLLHMSVKDFAKIKTADFDFGPTMTILSSKKNAQGKSSGIAALLTALRGSKFLPKVPVHSGADQAEIILTINSPTGEIVLTTIVKPDGTIKATLKNADGFKSNTPRSTLDEWLNALGADPLAFIQVEGKKRVELLKKAFGLDFGILDTQRKEIYEKRTGQNAIVRDLEGKYNLLEKVPSDTPDEPVDSKALFEELRQAQEHNAKGELLGANVSSLLEKKTSEESRITQQSESVETLKKQLEEAESRLKAMNATHELTIQSYGQAGAAQSEFKEIDTTEINAKIESAATTNVNVAIKKRRVEDRKAFQDAQELSESMTKQINDIDKKKAEMIAGINLPLEGLEIREDDVYYKGLPIESASTGEQLRVSIPIVFASDARLKFTTIRGGNDLDEENLALICELTEAAGGQVIIERLGKESGENIVVFEDGETK